MLLFAGEELAERLERDRARALVALERAAGRPGADLVAVRRRCMLRVPRLYDEAETCTVERVDGGQRYMVRFEVPYDGEPDCLFLAEGDPVDEDCIEVSGRMVVISLPVPAAGADRDVAGVARDAIERHDLLLNLVDAGIEAQAASIGRVNAELETAIARAVAARARQDRLRDGLGAALRAAREAATDQGEDRDGPSMGYG